MDRVRGVALRPKPRWSEPELGGSRRDALRVRSFATARRTATAGEYGDCDRYTPAWDVGMPRYRVRLNHPVGGSTPSQKVAAVAWGLVLVAALVVGVIVAPTVFYVVIVWLADRVATALVLLVGIRGLELLMGVPMLLLAAWGLLRIIRGTSAPNTTSRQALIGAASMVLVGALGAGLVISAIAGGGEARPSGF